MAHSNYYPGKHGGAGLTRKKQGCSGSTSGEQSALITAINKTSEITRRLAAQKLERQMAEIAAGYETAKTQGRIHCIRRGHPDDFATVAAMVMSDEAGLWVKTEARVSPACPFPARAFEELVRRRTEQRLVKRGCI